MPHNIVEDRFDWAIWITGSPGVGLNSVGEALEGFMTDHIGYRESHRFPERWEISEKVLRYKMTNPEAENPYFYGYGQNYSNIARLPWKYVILLMTGEEQLGERITTYREEHNINEDGRTTEEVIQSASRDQLRMMEEIPRHATLHLLDASESVESIVANIKAEKWTRTHKEGAKVKSSDSIKFVPGLGWVPKEVTPE
jgi:hypothetical protein